MSDFVGYVLDASVLVARVRRSELAYEDVRALMMRLAMRNAALYIPTIALVEVAAALSRSGSSTPQALAAVRDLGLLPSLSIVDVDATLGNLASDVAARQRIRGCDAVYVALARRMGVPLITLDRQQRERASGAIRAYTPAEALVHLG